MKTKELIRLLQENDPSGELEVVGSYGDIYFIERLPDYYDGKVNILIKDDEKIIGMKQNIGKDKIVLAELSLEDVMTDYWDDENFILEGDECFLNLANKYRKENKDFEDTFQFNSFKKYILEKNKSIFYIFKVNAEEIERFWNEHKNKLIRKDFNSIGSSINDKYNRYYNDCIKISNGKLYYNSEYETKDYNIEYLE